MTSLSVDHSPMLKSKSNLGKIFNYIITSTNMDQKWLANSLDISTSKMSRVMNGTISFDIEFWERVSAQYGLNFDAIHTGVITTYPKDSEIILKRFLPTRKDNFTGGNAVLIHKLVFIHFWGEKIFDEFCNSLRINPHVFVNGNNPSNLDFTLRLIQYSILKGKLKNLSDIENYADLAFQFSKRRDKLHYLFASQSGVEKVVNFITHICDHYEKNHNYKVEDMSLKDQWVDISFYPREHVDIEFYKNDPILGNSFEKYVQFYLANFMGSSVGIKTKQSLFKGDQKCIFRLLRQ